MSEPIDPEEIPPSAGPAPAAPVAPETPVEAPADPEPKAPEPPVEIPPEPAPVEEPAPEPEPEEPPLVLRRAPEGPPPPPAKPRRKVERRRPVVVRERRGGVLDFLRRLVLAVVLLAVLGPPLSVLVYRIVPPPITILMIERLFQGRGMSYHWRSLNHINPALVQAAVAAEDARFCEHHGFDFDAIEKAMAHNDRSKRIRGGSTISQQTAKNVFLWPDRSYVRKGLEAYYTVLIELVWGKRRIMETYLNVVEMGPGVYGAQAAAQRYFHTDAANLTRAQAAGLVAILPSPLKWKAVGSGKYVTRRKGKIAARAGVVKNEGLAACVY